MRAFRCDHCGNKIWFDNHVCVFCDSALGFDRELHTLVAMETSSLTSFRDGTVYRRCANAELVNCNWLVSGDAGPLCAACTLTQTRPPAADAGAMASWAGAESAKRRLVYQLDDLGLPIQARDEDHPMGLGFDLLSSRDEKVTTGHADGLITIDLAEGYDAHREAMRARMSEPYRTMLGHFRHETGHYYESVLILDTAWQDSCRELFGDDRADYGEALKVHYDEGPPSGWEQDYVSAYATTHPYEDWAETFAHYLHIRDTLQTASAVGLLIDAAEIPTDAGKLSAQDLIAVWLPLTTALNAVEASMGKDDLYPFVLAPHVIDKLAFVHEVVTSKHP